MINYNSDFSSQPKFTRYYGLNNIPETMFLMEAECFDPPEDRISNTQYSETGIFFALGVIVILVVFSGFQLNRSLEVTPANPATSRGKSVTVIPRRNFDRVQKYKKRDFSTDEREILMLKNAIAHGKF